MRIAIYLEDTLFSRLIRTRDNWTCQRCFKRYEVGDGALQNSHFWSRRHWGVRFDLLNCDALCFGCHQLWEGDKHGAYRDWKLRQLGEKAYRDLEIRARMYCKKDRKLALIYVNNLIKEYEKNTRGSKVIRPS